MKKRWPSSQTFGAFGMSKADRQSLEAILADIKRLLSQISANTAKMANGCDDDNGDDGDRISITIPDAKISNLSGDYCAWHGSRLAFMRADFWFLFDVADHQDGETITAKALFGRAERDTVMNDFMWTPGGDYLHFLVEARGPELVQAGHETFRLRLPAVPDVTHWYSGSGSGETTQFVRGWSQHFDTDYIQPFKCFADGLYPMEGFWMSSATAWKRYHNMHIRKSGFALNPQTSDHEQRFHHTMDFDGGNLKRIEPIFPNQPERNCWSHETWDGDRLVAYDLHHDTIVFRSECGQLDPRRNIRPEDVAIALGKEGHYVQYQHGDYRNGRLVFSAKDHTEGTHHVLYADRDVLRVVDTDVPVGDPDNVFSDNLLPSLNQDGTLCAFHSAKGVEIRSTGHKPQ